MELGLYTFGDLIANAQTGRLPRPQERMRQMIDMAILADEAGLDIVGVGEHHGVGFVNSATAVTIAAMAQATKQIRLTSAVTLLSTADPVRTFQEFATADLVSEGRVELIFGRGAFTESFPLFGFDLKDYDALFAEKLGLFTEINTKGRVTWSGRFRAALQEAEIAPRPAQGRLPVWIGAGSPASIERAARLGYPLAIPVLGGNFHGYAQLAQHYRHVRSSSGHSVEDSRIAVFSHLHVTATDIETHEDFYPNYSAYLRPLFKGGMSRQAYEQMLAPGGSLVGGDVQRVIDKLVMLREMTGATRYVGQIDIGGQSFSDVAKGIELFAAKVAPALRKAAASASDGVTPITGEALSRER
jgi:alkanesulfonate monooxygenase SsuD/methylene tetrahydromethanopterin reductase-like flavin-dependent oxidoreductase (luciferase family)